MLACLASLARMPVLFGVGSPRNNALTVEQYKEDEMRLQFLCDYYEKNYESIIKQTLLFNEQLTIYYPSYSDINLRRQNEKIGKLSDVGQFKGVKLEEIQCEEYRTDVLGIEKTSFFELVTNQLDIPDIEKECLIVFFDAMFWRDWFMNNDKFKKHCGYIYEIYKLLVHYMNFYDCFLDVWEYSRGNIMSNSSALMDLFLADSNVLQQDRKIFSKKYTNFEERCRQCKRLLRNGQQKDEWEINLVRDTAINILFPDFSFLPMEEIYEIRLKAKDEIQQLDDYINHIKISDNDKDNIEEFLKQKINPAVKELECKIKNLKLTILQKTLNVRNITYMPLIVTLFPELPKGIALLISAGVISADALLEIIKEKNKIKQDELYFALKINKIISRRVK